MFGSGHIPELLILLAVVLIIFGPSKLPDVGRGMGRAIKEFRNAMQETTQSVTPIHTETPVNNNSHGATMPANRPVPVESLRNVEPSPLPASTLLRGVPTPVGDARQIPGTVAAMIEENPVANDRQQSPSDLSTD